MFGVHVCVFFRGVKFSLNFKVVVFKGVFVNVFMCFVNKFKSQSSKDIRSLYIPGYSVCPYLEKFNEEIGTPPKTNMDIQKGHI